MSTGSDLYYALQSDLAAKLSEIKRGLKEKRGFFGNSGAEAIEAALKLAWYHTKRPLVLAFLGAFHGRTIGALSLTASKVIHEKGFSPLVPGITHVPYTYCYRCPYHHDELMIKGYSVVEPIKVACEFAKIEFSKTTLAIQGFGAVGKVVVKFSHEMGASIVAGADSSGAVYDPMGIDVPELLKIKQESGKVIHYQKGHHLQRSLQKEPTLPPPVMLKGLCMNGGFGSSQILSPMPEGLSQHILS